MQEEIPKLQGGEKTIPERCNHGGQLRGDTTDPIASRNLEGKKRYDSFAMQPPYSTQKQTLKIQKTNYITFLVLEHLEADGKIDFTDVAKTPPKFRSHCNLKQSMLPTGSSEASRKSVGCNTWNDPPPATMMRQSYLKIKAKLATTGLYIPENNEAYRDRNTSDFLYSSIPRMKPLLPRIGTTKAHHVWPWR